MEVEPARYQKCVRCGRPHHRHKNRICETCKAKIVIPKKKQALEISADLWNKIREIDEHECHQDDITDVKFHIHAIQNILLAQLYLKRGRKKK